MKYLLASLFLLIFGFIGLLSPLRDFVLTFVTPIQFGLRKSTVDFKDTARFFLNAGKVREENLLLLDHNRNLEQQLVDLKLVQNENLLLKEQLKVKAENEKLINVAVGYVLGNPNDPTQSTLFFDKGSKDGIRVGDVAIVKNIVVGTVTNTSYSRSTIELIISANSAFTVYDLNFGVSIEGLAKGEHGSSILVERILPSETIEAGDTILTSGRDGKLPRGLVVGKISQIISDPAQPLKKAYVESPLDFSKLDLVFIVREE